MKDRIFWIGLIAIALVLEFFLISSPLMFHFVAMLLLVALFLFRRPIVFAIGVCLLGYLLWTISLTPPLVLLLWLGSWTLIMGGWYMLTGRSLVWPIPIGIVLFRLLHYLFSAPSFFDILERGEIWAGMVLNVVLATFLAWWLRHTT
ncbi:MAG: hypothetical protein BRC23_00055 [Parcubacteria group bacterium SW_4_49_11]|nr:MAG: hypothetical protein BRC23_00055 [Parcubacteria group bacterium SW_4_49_11]